MFDAHVVFPHAIEDVLKVSVTTAYPWKLSIESLDTVVLLYSLLVVCYAILYNNITEQIAAARGPKVDEIVTAKHLNNELLLYDLGYWVLLYLVIFIAIDCTSYVSISLMTAWSALMYTSTLYAACLVADMGSISRILCVLGWAVQTMMITFITNASLFNGSFILFIHIYNAIFCYIQLAEGSVNYIRFVNLRIWGVVFLNLCLLVTYVNNISYVEQRREPLQYDNNGAAHTPRD